MLSYLGPMANVTLAQNCEAAVEALEPLAPMVSVFYYAMIGFGIVAFIAVLLIIFTYMVGVPIISRIADTINYGVIGLLFGYDSVMPILSSIIGVSSAMAAVAGWAAREIGHQPWTIYGLITTNEVVTPVTITPGFVAFAIAVFLIIAIGGTLAMYYAVSRPELLDRLKGFLRAVAYE